MAQYIIEYKQDDNAYAGLFLNHEWRNGRKHPESVFGGFNAQLLTERQKDYFVDLLTNNCNSFRVITVVK